MNDLRLALTRHPGPSAFAIATVVAFAVAHARSASPRVLAYLVVFAVVARLVARCDRDGALSRGVWWGLAVLTLLHLSGGLLPALGAPGGVLYETWLVESLVKFDQAVHLYGTALVTVGLWQVRRSGSLVGAWVGALAIGMANEAIEFALARNVPTHVGDWDNAVWDLAFNLAGATMAALWLAGSQTATRVPSPAR